MKSFFSLFKIEKKLKREKKISMNTLPVCVLQYLIEFMDNQLVFFKFDKKQADFM